MQIDYDQEPDIPPFTGIETGVRTFWDISRAVKGLSIQTYTIGRVFEILHPLKMQSRYPTLRLQAEALAELVVKGKMRRTTLHKKDNIVQLFPVTKNIEQDTLAKKAV